jgi:hypothetical protein
VTRLHALQGAPCRAAEVSRAPLDYGRAEVPLALAMETPRRQDSRVIDSRTFYLLGLKQTAPMCRSSSPAAQRSAPVRLA